MGFSKEVSTKFLGALVSAAAVASPGCISSTATPLPTIEWLPSGGDIEEYLTPLTVNTGYNPSDPLEVPTAIQQTGTLHVYTDTIFPVQDGFISFGDKTNISSFTDPDLLIVSSTDKNPENPLKENYLCYSLIQFPDLSSYQGLPLVEAKLGLFIHENRNLQTGSALEVLVGKINSPWQEYTLNYTTTPRWGSVMYVLRQTIAENEPLDFVELDVTALVEEWINNPEENHGLALDGSRGASRAIFGGNGLHRPFLSISYQTYNHN